MAMVAHPYMLAAKETITIAPGQTRTIRMQARLEPIPVGPATQPAPAGDSERAPSTDSGQAEEIDFIKLRATLCETYARSEKDQRNLHIMALVQQYEPGEAAGQWVKSPAYTRTWSWYERRREAKARIDYDPQKLKWVGGTRPYSETRFMLAFDGSGFRKIDFVYGYGEAPRYWPRVTENYDTNNPKRLAIAARDTGIAFLPEPPASFPSRELTGLEYGFAAWVGEVLQPWTEELARKAGIQASKVTSNGLTLIRVTLPRGNNIRTVFLDPQRGYSLVRAETSSDGNLTSLYQADQWKQLTPNLWFPVKWTAQAIGSSNAWRLDYEASEVGFYDPAQGPDIFGAKDVKLGVRIDRPPHGPASAPPPATQPTSQPAVEAPWGEAVEGVQVRLRAGKVQWKAGETPTLVADARNLGTLKLRGSPYLFSYSVQIDGQWFQRTIITASSGSLDFGPGKQFLDTGIRLIGLELRDPTTHKALELKPGKHTVRVAFAADGEKKGVRAVSNAVEIEVQPADAKAAPQPAGGKLEFRIAPSPSALSKEQLTWYVNVLKEGKVGFWWIGGPITITGPMPDHAWLAFAGDMANAGNLVTGEYKGQKYVLASDKPGQTMVTGEGKEAWGLTMVRATTDAMNRPTVGFELDNSASSNAADTAILLRPAPEMNCERNLHDITDYISWVYRRQCHS